MRLSLAISPCPNDTFAFYKLIATERYAIDFLDIEELNRALLAGKYPIAKGSFAIMEKLAPKYEILATGAAIGNGVGPVFIGQLAQGARIGLPGEHTTAHQLFRFWLERHAEHADVRPMQMPFYEMLPALKSGQIDAAVLIHEGRFVYKAAGLPLIADLGAYWENQTRAMIPLGCIYIHRDLASHEKHEFVTALKDSLSQSLNAYRTQSPLYKESILPYMQERAQEKNADVVAAHVATYVTDDTLELGAAARASIAEFRKLLTPVL